MGTVMSRSPHGLQMRAIFAVLALGVSLDAAGNPQLPSQTAKFGDLNVSTSAGAAALYDRIVAAAKGACSYYWFKTDADETRCIHNAIAAAVTKVNQPALFVVYGTKNPAPPVPALARQSR